MTFGPQPPISYGIVRSEEHTSELQSRLHLVCRLLLEKKKRSGTPATRYRTTTICCHKPVTPPIHLSAPGHHPNPHLPLPMYPPLHSVASCTPESFGTN